MRPPYVINVRVRETDINTILVASPPTAERNSASALTPELGHLGAQLPGYTAAYQ